MLSIKQILQFYKFNKKKLPKDKMPFKISLKMNYNLKSNKNNKKSKVKNNMKNNFITKLTNNCRKMLNM